MKIIDKIMDALSLYDEEEIFEDDELDIKEKSESQTEAPKTRPSLFQKKSIPTAKSGTLSETKPATREKKPVLSFRNPEDKNKKNTEMSKRTLNVPVANKLISVVLLEPVSFDDSQKIADYLRNNQPVVVNFANTENVVAKRMTDFISGTVYAIAGSMKKLGRNVLICAPKNVDIDAGVDITEERGNQPWEK